MTDGHVVDYVPISELIVCFQADMAADEPPDSALHTILGTRWRIQTYRHRVAQPHVHDDSRAVQVRERSLGKPLLLYAFLFDVTRNTQAAGTAEPSIAATLLEKLDENDVNAMREYEVAQQVTSTAYLG